MELVLSVLPMLRLNLSYVTMRDDLIVTGVSL